MVNNEQWTINEEYNNCITNNEQLAMDYKQWTRINEKWTMNSKWWVMKKD
jgi:hypothetical protein